MKFPYPGKYTFVDVEIPNLNNNCICAISILVFDEGEQVVSATELINPQTFFSAPNIRIHHIQRKDVINARTLEQFWQDYKQYFEQPYIIGAHNAMSDISVLNKDLARFHTEIHATEYLDTMDVMEQFYYKGKQGKGDLKLSNIAEHLNIELDHHNPQSDVNCCCQIVCYMYDHFQMDITPFIHKIRKTKFKPSKHQEQPTARQLKSYLSYVHKQLHSNAPSTRLSASKAKAKGDQCYEEGNYEGVIFNYELAAFKHWMSPGMYLRLAQVYESLNLRYDSIRILEKGIQNIKRVSPNWKMLKSAQYDIYSQRAKQKRKGKRQLTSSGSIKTAPNKDAIVKPKATLNKKNIQKEAATNPSLQGQKTVEVTNGERTSSSKANKSTKATKATKSNKHHSQRTILRRKAQTQVAQKAKKVQKQESNADSK